MRYLPYLPKPRLDTVRILGKLIQIWYLHNRQSGELANMFYISHAKTITISKLNMISVFEFKNKIISLVDISCWGNKIIDTINRFKFIGGIYILLVAPHRPEVKILLIKVCIFVYG